TASLRKLEGLKKSADAELAFADKALAAAKTDQARAQAEDRKQKAALKAEEAGKQLDAARADAKSKPDATAAKDAAKTAEAKKIGRHQGGDGGEPGAGAGLGLHQPRHAEAVRASQHPQAGAGRGRRGIRYDHRGSGRDSRSRQADRHAYIHGDG